MMENATQDRTALIAPMLLIVVHPLVPGASFKEMVPTGADIYRSNSHPPTLH
jgi:hypothetical protein